MRSPRRPLVVVALAVLVLVLQGLAHERVAHADARKDVQTKLKEAMEKFDFLEYEEAKKLLGQALAIAKKGKLDKDPITAQIHVRVGIVYAAGLKDTDAAKVAFAAAVELDPRVQIEAAYKTPELQRLLEDARGGAGKGKPAVGGGEAEPASGGDGPCTATGIEHTVIDTAPAGAALTIEAQVGADVQAAKVAILYRAKGATDFTEVKMTRSSGCTYAGSIPAAAFGGDVVHYYVAAYNKAGKAVASRGSSGAPNIIEVSGGSAAVSTDGADSENPFDEGGARKPGGGAAGGDGGTVEGGVTVSAKTPTIFVAVAGGAGGGYVSGKTEQAGSDVKCCFAPGLLHLLPEIGFYLNPQMTVSVAGRIGFPIGANIDGHATTAPAALVRMRYAFGETGNGVQVSGSLGGGIIRNTIKLREANPEMDTDIAAIGPLLAGFGAGYIAPLGGPVKLTAEVSTLAAVPVVDELGSAKVLNFGLQVDVNIGLLFGF